MPVEATSSTDHDVASASSSCLYVDSLKLTQLRSANTTGSALKISAGLPKIIIKRGVAQSSAHAVYYFKIQRSRSVELCCSSKFIWQTNNDKSTSSPLQKTSEQTNQLALSNLISKRVGIATIVTSSALFDAFPTYILAPHVSNIQLY